MCLLAEGILWGKTRVVSLNCPEKRQILLVIHVPAHVGSHRWCSWARKHFQLFGWQGTSRRRASVSLSLQRGWHTSLRLGRSAEEKSSLKHLEGLRRKALEEDSALLIAAERICQSDGRSRSLILCCLFWLEADSGGTESLRKWLSLSWRSVPRLKASFAGAVWPRSDGGDGPLLVRAARVCLGTPAVPGELRGFLSPAGLWGAFVAPNTRITTGTAPGCPTGAVPSPPAPPRALHASCKAL